MARPLRVEYLGAWYHVINRGAGRRPIFKNTDQRQYFLSLLAATQQRYNAEWHAYCLMGNHYHLMVRTPEGNLQRIMRHINGLYTQYFNRLENKEGSLFRGRYQAILVDADSYWLQLSRYIHRNPLEAKLCKTLADYPWSSYPAYIGTEKTPAWLHTKYILKAIAPRNSRQCYQAFVNEPVDKDIADFYKKKKISAVLGNKSFKSRVLAGIPKTVDVPELAVARIVPTLDQIVAAVCRYYDVESDVIWTQTRGKGVKSPARSVAMYLCQHAGDMTLAEIAKTFGLASYASSGATIRQIKARRAEQKELNKSINYILLDLTPHDSP